VDACETRWSGPPPADRLASVDLLIRPERPADFPAIRHVLLEAFDSTVEADGVENIRRSWIYLPALALVAEVGDLVVGHTMICRCTLTGDAGRRTVAMLTPLAVTPSRQRQGIGSALVRAALAGADSGGEPLVVLQGSPAYYGRLGFEDARRHGIEMELPDWAPPEAGQVRVLTSYDGGDATLRGTITYPPVYG
jgi:putative acetyltransferase